MKIWAIHYSEKDCVWQRDENAFTSRAKALAYVEKTFEGTAMKEIERETDKYGCVYITFQDKELFFVDIKWELVL